MRARTWAICCDVDIGKDDRGLDVAFGEDFAPRGDDQAVAVSLAAVFMCSALGGCENEALRFDGARADAGCASGRCRSAW